MADVEVRRTVSIKAETIGDVARWLAAVEDEPTSTALVDPVELMVTTGPASGGAVERPGFADPASLRGR